MKRNNTLASLINSIPVWTGTALILIVIAVLTLMPSDDAPSMNLPYADKVVHFLMFGVLSAVALFDYSRCRGRLSVFSWLTIALLASAAGGAIELLQAGMGEGRSAEWGDFIADSAGAFLIPLLFWGVIAGLVGMHELSLSDLHGGKQFRGKMMDLYLNSFPDDERRPLESMRKQIDSNDRFHFSKVKYRGKDVGFISWWLLDGAAYVEHFAIDPSKRSLGLGRKALEKFCQLQEENPIILEVEPSGANEMADRRIAFYERCGFSGHPEFEYIQPPYTPDLSPLPLMLMTKGCVKDLAATADELKHRVYGA